MEGTIASVPLHGGRIYIYADRADDAGASA